MKKILKRVKKQPKRKKQVYNNVIKYIDHNQKLEIIANEALKAAKKAHDDLGLAGEDAIQKNKFGDTSLRVDIEAENAVLNTFRGKNVPIKIISEEHGNVLIGNNPQYLGMLDGLDGTGVYKKERGKGMYGTMLGVYEGVDPSYSDYIYGGIFIHSKNQLYFATKGKGGFVVEKNHKTSLHCSKKTNLDDSVIICADLNYDLVYKTDVLTTLMKKFKSYNILVTRSYAAHYADLVLGKVDAVIGFTRKDDLEVASAFPLILEAGGVVIDENGKSLAGQKYNKMREKEYSLFISAGTLELTQSIRAKLIM